MAERDNTGNGTATGVVAIRKINQGIVDALVPTNPRVIRLANRLRWKPETAVAKIKSALPSLMEQQIYLAVAADYRIKPSSLKTILRTYLQDRELTVEDLLESPEFFDQVAEYIDEVLTLVEKTSLQYGDIGFGMETASRLVLAYGEHAECIMSSIEANLSELSIRLKMEERSPERVMGYAVHFLVWTIIPYNCDHGVPDVTNIIDYFNDPGKLLEFTMNRFLGYEEAAERDYSIRLKELMYDSPI